jgi:hypothetical protein
LSPILVRPVREQLEHDRVIRLLQAKYKRKFDVAINPGNEQTTPVAVGTSPWYPDLVLQSNERGKKLLGTVEVETAESVNNLEAMSQWRTFSRLRAPFHLYVPSSSIDTARRLCADFEIAVAEIWAYNALGDQVRFTLVHRNAAADNRSRIAAQTTTAARKTGTTPPRRAATPRPARRTAPTASPRRKPAAAKKTTPARRTTDRKKSSGSSRAQKRK